MNKSDALGVADIIVHKTGDPSPGGIQAKLWAISQTPKLTAAEMHRLFCAAVLSWLHERGAFYHLAARPDFDGGMFFDGERKLLLRIRSDSFLAWLADSLGMNRGERGFILIQSAVETESLTDRSTGIEPATYWASRSGAVYLSNGPGHMARVTAEGVVIVDNGTDGVLFPSSAVLPPWKLTQPANPFESCAVFREMSAAAPHGKIIFMLWAASLPTDQRTKPPLVTTGPVGSGKTRSIVGIFELFGIPARVAAVTKNGEGDFWAAMDSGGLACFDNADTRIDWLPDAIAAAATAGCQEKRRLYTDSDRVVLRARSWIAVTSANPAFASDAGLSDRLLVVRLNRRNGETAEATLADEIAAARDSGLSWICHAIADALLDAEPTPSGLNQRHPDFASFAVRIGRAIGMEAEAVAALRAAEEDKSLFNLENDSIGTVILETMRRGESFTGSAGELLEKMKTVDSSLDGKVSAQRLSKRISKLWPHLEAIFKARQEIGHGGLTRYTLNPPPNGDHGDYKTDFSEKSLRGENIESLSKTPINSHHSHHAPALEGF